MTSSAPRFHVGMSATARNQPAERLFAEHRFASLDPDGRMWRLELDAASLEPPPFVALETCEEVEAGGR